RDLGTLEDHREGEEIDDVVVDDQGFLAGQTGADGVGGRTRGLGDGDLTGQLWLRWGDFGLDAGREVHRECAADVGGAGEGDLAAQQPYQFEADRESEARAPVLAAGRPVG